MSNSNENKKQSFSKVAYEWIEELVLAIVLVVILFSFVFRVVTVNGTSMQPNYYQNDRLVVTNFHPKIQQGDVVVIVDVLENPIIKRVIATEGQTVDIDSEKGLVYVDGKVVDEAQFNVQQGITTTTGASLATLDFPQTVPEGCVFVLGDNRAVSEDSRYKAVGMVDKRKILGKAFLSIFPFDKIGFIE